MREGAREYGITPGGYRLPDSTRLGPVHLAVADLARSVEWYERVIGLRVLSRAGRRVSLGVHGEGVGAAEGGEPLVVLVEEPGARPVPRSGRLGLYHYAILLPSRADLGRFVRHIAELGERVGASDHRVSEAIYLHDPDGLGVEVYADRPRRGWSHTDRQLEMDTRPLDVEDLVAEAGGEGWTGAPEGTVIGHMHLHVGDLERASTFYHDGLGFDKVVWSYPGALFLSAGGYHHHLGLNTWARGAPRAAEGEARLTEWTLVLPTTADTHAALESVGAVGGAVDLETRTARDPWGTVLRLEGEG